MTNFQQRDGIPPTPHPPASFFTHVNPCNSFYIVIDCEIKTTIYMYDPPGSVFMMKTIT